MGSRPKTTTGKIKVNLAFDPQVHNLLLELAGGSREQGRFISDLVLAEAQRRREGDMRERLRTVEEQIATLMEAQHA